jgi:hypothetical protein
VGSPHEQHAVVPQHVGLRTLAAQRAQARGPESRREAEGHHGEVLRVSLLDESQEPGAVSALDLAEAALREPESPGKLSLGPAPFESERTDFMSDSPALKVQ